MEKYNIYFKSRVFGLIQIAENVGQQEVEKYANKKKVIVKTTNNPQVLNKAPKV